MRMFFACIVLLGFVLFDVVAILALCNMIGWTAIGWEMLVLLLGIGVVSMAAGMLVLHRIEKTSGKG